MNSIDDLRGRLVEFSPADVYHPEPATVHGTYCRKFILQGICEEVVAGDVDGGPYVVVRIEPGQDPVIVSVKHLQNVLWGGENK